MRTENLVVVVLLAVVASVFVAAVEAALRLDRHGFESPRSSPLCSAGCQARVGTASLSALVFVSIPPSKARGDPLYDDRVTRMLRAISRSPASGNQLATES